MPGCVVLDREHVDARLGWLSLLRRRVTKWDRSTYRRDQRDNLAVALSEPFPGTLLPAPRGSRASRGPERRLRSGGEPDGSEGNESA